MNSKQKGTLLFFFYLVSFSLHAQNTGSKDSLVYVNKDIVINNNYSYIHKVHRKDAGADDYAFCVLKNIKISNLEFFVYDCSNFWLDSYEKVDKKDKVYYNFSVVRLDLKNDYFNTSCKKGLFIKYQKNKKWYYKKIPLEKIMIKY
jgi:hypothetical protein